jgi:hypothetical protein
VHQVGDLFQLNVKLRCQKVKHFFTIRTKCKSSFLIQDSTASLRHVSVYYIYYLQGEALIIFTRPTALYCVMCVYKHNQRKAPETWTSCRGSECVELYLLDPHTFMWRGTYDLLALYICMTSTHPCNNRMNCQPTRQLFPTVRSTFFCALPQSFFRTLWIRNWIGHKAKRKFLIL